MTLRQFFKYFNFFICKIVKRYKIDSDITGLKNEMFIIRKRSEIVTRRFIWYMNRYTNRYMNRYT